MNFVGAFDEPGAGMAVGPLVVARVVDIVSGMTGLFSGEVNNMDSKDSGEEGVVSMGVLGELFVVSLWVYLTLVSKVSKCPPLYGKVSLLLLWDVMSGKVNSGWRIIGTEVLAAVLCLRAVNRPLESRPCTKGFGFEKEMVFICAFGCTCGWSCGRA